MPRQALKLKVNGQNVEADVEPSSMALAADPALALT